MIGQRPKWNEDWLAVWIGLAIFAVSLGMLAGVDLLGWVVKTNVWLRPSEALSPVSKAYAAAAPRLLSLAGHLPVPARPSPRLARRRCG